MVHISLDLEVVAVAVSVHFSVANADLAIRSLLLIVSTHVRDTPLRLALHLGWHPQLVIALVSGTKRTYRLLIYKHSSTHL